MIDYFSEARICATVSVTGNLSRILGVALSDFHRHQSQRIQLLESSKDAGADYMVAIIKCEIAEFERWHRNVENLIGYQRDSKASADAETPEHMLPMQREEAA